MVWKRGLYSTNPITLQGHLIGEKEGKKKIPQQKKMMPEKTRKENILKSVQQLNML